MQRAHAAAVSAVVFETPDSYSHAGLHRSPSLNDLREVAEPRDRLYTASFDKAIHRWDLLSGKKTHIYAGHTRPVLCLAVHGGRVFSGGMDGSVRVWDAESGDCLHVLTMDTDVLALSAGINVLYAGGRDGGLRVWNVSAGKLVKVLGLTASNSPSSTAINGGSSASTTATISPLNSDNEVEYAKPEAGGSLSNTSRKEDESLSGSIVDTIINPIQRRASNLGLGTLFTSATQSLFGNHSSDGLLPPGHKPSAVRTVSIGLLPGQVFSAGDDAIIYEWDVKAGGIMRKFDNHSAGILWVFVEKPITSTPSVNSGAGRLYSASLDGCVRVFEIDDNSR
ncbi:WD40-repeat-containing domain protein [Obelidium mucronatum]|nr:WD40-repeat-containing domain protein [Obelidium mucronatum]